MEVNQNSAPVQPAPAPTTPQPTKPAHKRSTHAPKTLRSKGLPAGVPPPERTNVATQPKPKMNTMKQDKASNSTVQTAPKAKQGAKQTKPIAAKAVTDSAAPNPPKPTKIEPAQAPPAAKRKQSRPSKATNPYYVPQRYPIPERVRRFIYRHAKAHFDATGEWPDVFKAIESAIYLEIPSLFGKRAAALKALLLPEIE